MLIRKPGVIMKRLGHKKSRAGCMRCKQRRVKCDESSPCGACVKHGVSCSLAQDTGMADGQPRVLRPTNKDAGSFINCFPKNFRQDESESSSAASTPPPLSGGTDSAASAASVASATSPGSNPNFSAIGPVPYFSDYLRDIQRERLEDWTADMELMHHYTAVAHGTFTRSGDVHHALQHDVVHTGLEYGFLLQQILAFSGFHLSYTRPDQRRSYTLRATRHQDQAIAGFRTALTGEVTSKNCHALYASSIFLVICAFATFPSYEAHNKAFSPVDAITDILRLVDGISVILRGSDQDIRGGPLQGLFTGKSGSPAVISNRVQQLVDRLRALDLHSLAQGCDDEEEHEIGMYAHLCQSMIEALLNVHRNASSVVSPELRSLFLWPMLLSHRHLDLIRNRRPLALVVLTHYCVILHYAAEDCWFLEGWAQAVGDSLEGALAGTIYEEAIELPMSIIGRK